VRVLITVQDDDPDGQRLLSWLESGPAARQVKLEPVGRRGEMGAADILGTVADVAGLTALVFQVGGWWLARSRRPGAHPPRVTIERGDVKATIESADPDRLRQIIAALEDGDEPGAETAGD
jgi:hypothetical protein